MSFRSVALTALLLAGCPPDNASPGLVGAPCSLSTSCARGLVCAQDGVCREGGTPGTVLQGDPCEATAQCALDLACASSGTCEDVGSAGTATTGETCATTSDCRSGLECAGEVCIGLEIPYWAGVECIPPEEETGAFRPYFEIHRDEKPADFYRLPYPNDLRIDDGGLIDLSDHPYPDSPLEQVGDVVGNIIRVVEQNVGGFGPNQAVFMRFSGTPDFNTIDVGIPGEGSVALVDITPGDGINRTLHPSVRYRVSTARTRYICQNWLAVWPGDGVPMQPGHTYAVVLSRDITDERGTRLEPDDDFRALLLPDLPSDPALVGPWDTYAPLRDWLNEVGIDQARIGGGTVFTIEDTAKPPTVLRRVVHEQVLPTLSGATACTDGDPFADPTDETRGCQGDGSYHEVHAQVALPQFQVGDPPFKDAVDGGTIDFRGLPPQPSRTELVNVVMTIPTGEAPADGWPLVLYGHGTGGNYTSVIREGVVDMVHEIERGEDTVRFATMSFDAPLHGPRAARDNWKADWLAVDPNAYDSDVLFYNPLNLAAARDNTLQMAADMWSLVRLAKSLNLDALSSPTGEPITFDADHLYYLGHSQGGTVATTFLSVEPDIKAAVLSGAGGLTIRSFLEKTSPVNLSSAIKLALAELTVERDHPLLNLAQQISERSDGVNHARRIMRAPYDDIARKPILQIFGVGDSYTPDSAQFSLARAMGLQQVPGGSTPLDTLTATSLPATNNGPADTTAVVHLYDAISEDPHFVLFERADAQQHVKSFLATSVLEGAPTVEGL